LAKSIRLTVIRGEAAEDGEDLVLINPTITKSSSTTVSMEEGCLSIPGVYGNVIRPESITLRLLTNTENFLNALLMDY